MLGYPVVLGLILAPFGSFVGVSVLGEVDLSGLPVLADLHTLPELWFGFMPIWNSGNQEKRIGRLRRFASLPAFLSS